MELLRIIAMAMVVMCHTNYWALGEPTFNMCANEPIRAFSQYLIESMSVVCVNCFVFISGWFSIKPSIRGFSSFIFQLLFYSTLIYFSFYAVGVIQFSMTDFLNHANFMANFWFVRVYIALYLLSPIYNIFIDHAGRQMAKTTLLAFVLLDVLFGWGVDYMKTGAGYSLFHLSVIYIVARYIKVYGGKYFSFDKWSDLSVYLLITVVTALIILVSARVCPSFWCKANRVFIYNYNAPLIIIASIYLSLFFTKLNFKSRLVNLVGASSFAVFLIHGDRLILKGVLKPFCQDLFFNNNIFYFSIMMALLIVALFVVAFLVDQVRQWLWGMIQKAFF